MKNFFLSLITFSIFLPIVIGIPSSILMAQCPTGVSASSTNNPVCEGDSALLSTALIGPCSTYSVSSITYSPVAGAGPAVTLSNDQVSNALPIGFTFNFFCVDYTQFYVSSNGFITFTSTTNSGCCSGQFLPDASAPNNLIALAWEDLDPSAGGTIDYFTTGVAPNRRLVVRFSNVPHYPSGNAVTTQVVLYETTNEIEIHTTSMVSDGGNHTMGVEDAAGALGFAAPGRNASNWTTLNDGKRFTPGASPSGSFVYSWVPTTGLSNPNISNPLASPSVTTTYTVTVTEASCSSVSDTITVYVDTTYISVSILNPDTFICTQGSVQMAIADSNAASYLWSPAAGLSCITCPNPIASPSFTTIYSITAYTAMGICNATDTISISVGNLSQIQTTASDTTMCGVGDTVQLNVFVTGASCTDYMISNIPFSPVTGSGTPVVLGDDQLSSTLPIGFTFNFYCNNYTNFNISSNGFITFDPLASNGCCQGQLLPNTTSPNNLIALAWDDLNPGAGGTIDYFTTGTAPNRRLVVRFNNVPHYGGGGGPVTSQVVLYESTNMIEIHTTSMLTDGSMHTMGLENDTGTIAHPVSGRNADATWSVFNEGIRFLQGNTSGTLVYAWNPAAGLSDSTIANPLAFPSQTTTYTVTVADSICTISDTITIYVDTTTVSVGITTPDTAICYGASVQINTTAIGAAAYQWAPATGLSCSTCPNPVATPSVTTTYSVTVYSAIGACESMDTINISVSNLTQVTPTATPNPLCIGDTAQLNVLGGSCSDYTIISIPFAPVSGSGNSVSLGDDQLSSTLPIGFTFNFYCNNYTNFNISSNGFVTFDPLASNGCCQGQFLPNTVSPNNLIAFAWVDLNPSVGGTIDYFTTGTAPNRKLIVNFNNVPHYSGGGGPVTAQIILYESTNLIEIHTTSMLTDGGLHTMGLEDAAGTNAHPVSGRNANGTWSASNEGLRFIPGSLLAGSYTYSWTPSATLSDSTIANPFAWPTSTTTYTVTVLDTVAGCSSTATVTVTLSPLPTASVSPSSASICFGQNTTLTASGGVSYSWLPGGQTSSAIIVSQTNTYSVIVTNATGCTAVATSSVVVNSVPTITVSGSTSLCSGSSTTLTAGGGVSYSWLPGGQSTSSITVSPTTNTTYTVIGSSAAGCTNTAAVTVSVIQQPVAAFTYTVNSTIVNFTSTSQNATSWFWDFGDAGTSTVQNPFHVYAAYGTYTVTLIASNACGSDTISVTITLVGIEEYPENYIIQVYPNPASDKITVQIQMLNPTEKGGELSVINILGKEIYYMNIPPNRSYFEQQIELGSVSSGIYLIKVSLDGAVRRQTIVIQQ